MTARKAAASRPARPSASSAPSSSPEEPAELLSAAVAACPAVDALSGGAFGEVATYLPGRRIPGIRLDARTVEVHVVAVWGVPMADVAEQVRAACTPLAQGRRIDVSIDDVREPADHPA